MSHREKMLDRILTKAAQHDNGCDCTTCRAAAGDEQAKRELLRELL